MSRYAIYIHGLGSGANSGTKSSFLRYFPDYEWICPEVTENITESLAIIKEHMDVFSPEIIAGTSLGGLYTLYTEAPSAAKIVCNVTVGIERVLRKIGYGKHSFFCEREDGRTEYTIDETLVRSFTEFKKAHTISLGAKNLGVFSTRDELVGQVESRNNAKFLQSIGFEIRWSDKFGHRTNEQVAKKIPGWLAELT